MRKLALLAVGLSLALAGVALAVSFKTGLYKSGKSISYSTHGFELRLEVHRHSFSVQRISFPEMCTGGPVPYTDEFSFVQGSSASLTGAIANNGQFSGKYRSGGNTVTVSGRVEGSKATVKGSETSAGNPGYNCSGSHTFHAAV
jgi:hypothetical protein